MILGYFCALSSQMCDHSSGQSQNIYCSHCAVGQTGKRNDQKPCSVPNVQLQGLL